MTDAAPSTEPPRFRDQTIAFEGIGVGRKGAKIGSRPGEAELFRDDMLAFWTRLFGKPS